MKRISILLITVALIAGMVGCDEGECGILTITSTDGGSVTVPGEGNRTCECGTVVDLVATPDAGYRFVNWTGDVDTIADVYAASTTITMNGVYSITANFDENPEIRDWYDLDAVRNNLDGDYILMNDLNSTTAGYEELASPTANEGKGWVPIGTWNATLDGQGYEIRDFFIYNPQYDSWPLGVAFFAFVDSGGTIKNLGVRNARVTGGNMTGGLVGNNRGTVSKCYSSGNVTIYGYGSYIGGLVGINDGGTVSNSYSTFSVTGTGWVGGLVGGNEEGTVSNSYSTGSVTGNSSVGGLVGWNWNGAVSNSYATGSVTGDEWAGGLVGKSHNSTVNNSFWDTETSGQATSGGGTGKNTTEMQDITTFSDAGWNIVAVANPSIRNSSYIWNIVDDETYPFLRWQPIL